MNTQGTEKIAEQAFTLLQITNVELTIGDQPTIKLGNGVMRLRKKETPQEALEERKDVGA
jgi:hypothetical protein